MKELNFTRDELNEAIRGNYVASGSEASIYKYKKYIAIRLYDIEGDIYCHTHNIINDNYLDKVMIENLHVYKDRIKLSSFPIGIVKVEGKTVGQIIKYYNNSITLTDFFKNSPSVDPIPYYLKILDILEELSLNGICYEDVHGGNFLIVGNKMRVVDFSNHRVKINQNYRELYYNMFQNFNVMVNKLNFEVLGLEDEYERLVIPSEIKKDTLNLEDDFDFIRDLVKHLKKKTRTRK